MRYIRLIGGITYVISQYDVVQRAQKSFAIFEHGAGFGEHLEGLLANFVFNDLYVSHRVQVIGGGSTRGLPWHKPVGLLCSIGPGSLVMGGLDWPRSFSQPTPTLFPDFQSPSAPDLASVLLLLLCIPVSDELSSHCP